MVTILKADHYKVDAGDLHVHSGTPRGCSAEFCLCTLLALLEFQWQKDLKFLPETEKEENYSVTTVK